MNALHKTIEDAAVARGELCPDMCGEPYILVHDASPMPDGRPFFAWVYEIDSLRTEVADLKSGDREEKLQAWQGALRVARWYVEQHPTDLGGSHVHIRFDALRALDTRLEDALEVVSVTPAAEAVRP